MYDCIVFVVISLINDVKENFKDPDMQETEKKFNCNFPLNMEPIAKLTY